MYPTNLRYTFWYWGISEAQEFLQKKKWNKFNVQVSHLISAHKSSFSIIEDKTEDRKVHKQATTEGGCSEGLTKHLQGGNSEYGEAQRLQASWGH